MRGVVVVTKPKRGWEGESIRFKTAMKFAQEQYLEHIS